MHLFRLGCSGSMGGILDQARLAVTEFLKTANRKDEFFIVFFGDQLELASDFSTATEEIQHQLIMSCTSTWRHGSTTPGSQSHMEATIQIRFKFVAPPPLGVSRQQDEMDELNHAG
jgi:hypothetical protein